MRYIRQLISETKSWTKFRLLHLLRKPSEVIKLNLGCGSDLKFGYINVDINPFYRPDILGEIIPVMKNFEKESVNEIQAIHVINYFSHQELLDFLQISFQILEFEGSLVIEGPDLAKILTQIDTTNFQPASVYPLFASNFDGPTHEKPYLNAVEYKWFKNIVRSIGFNQVSLMKPLTHGKNDKRDSRLVAIK